MNGARHEFYRFVGHDLSWTSAITGYRGPSKISAAADHCKLYRAVVIRRRQAKAMMMIIRNWLVTGCLVETENQY